ncbi:MAG TPA: chemotaxis protein CheW [Polyangiales bacterium]|nr:chemotaxis protein CheW [Polyangiales bacterium]
MSEPRTLPVLPDVDACWNRIGIRGDRSCPELQKVVHCRNCPVFANAAQRLLDRPAPDGYLSELTSFVAEPAVTGKLADRSALLFGVASERFAVESDAVLEVADVSPPRSVPHRSNDVFTGLINIRGQLELCMSLAGMLALPRKPVSASEGRVLVITLDGKRWALMLDAIHGVQRFHDSDLLDVPPTSRRRASELIKGLLVKDDEHYGLLDLPQLCAGFQEKLA